MPAQSVAQARKACNKPVTGVVDLSDSDKEEVRNLPDADKLVDPLLYAAVVNRINGHLFHGQVCDIDYSVITHERLYVVRYEDGDMQHMTAAEVYAMVERLPAYQPGIADFSIQNKLVHNPFL